MSQDSTRKKRGTTQVKRNVKLVSYVSQDVRKWIKDLSEASGVSESYTVQSLLAALKDSHPNGTTQPTG